MIVQGAGPGTGTSAAIPAHQAGDLLLVFARAASNTAPPKPAVAGTVPNWNVAQSAGANTLALVSAWFLATAANHTTGTWTGASHLCVLVLRPDGGQVLSVSGSSVGNGNNTQTLIYPALTLATLAGTSWGVRCGTRGVVDTDVINVPTNWTNQTAAGAIMAVHTRAALVASPIADSVAVPGTNSAYRAHTLEVTERPAQQPVVTIV